MERIEDLTSEDDLISATTQHIEGVARTITIFSSADDLRDRDTIRHAIQRAVDILHDGLQMKSPAHIKESVVRKKVITEIAEIFGLHPVEHFDKESPHSVLALCKFGVIWAAGPPLDDFQRRIHWIRITTDGKHWTPVYDEELENCCQKTGPYILDDDIKRGKKIYLRRTKSAAIDRMNGGTELIFVHSQEGKERFLEIIEKMKLALIFACKAVSKKHESLDISDWKDVNIIRGMPAEADIIDDGDFVIIRIYPKGKNYPQSKDAWAYYVRQKRRELRAVVGGKGWWETIDLPEFPIPPYPSCVKTQEIKIKKDEWRTLMKIGELDTSNIMSINSLPENHDFPFVPHEIQQQLELICEGHIVALDLTGLEEPRVRHLREFPHLAAAIFDLSAQFSDKDVRHLGECKSLKYIVIPSHTLRLDLSPLRSLPRLERLQTSTNYLRLYGENLENFKQGKPVPVLQKAIDDLVHAEAYKAIRERERKESGKSKKMPQSTLSIDEIPIRTLRIYVFSAVLGLGGILAKCAMDSNELEHKTELEKTTLVAKYSDVMDQCIDKTGEKKVPILMNQHDGGSYYEGYPTLVPLEQCRALQTLFRTKVLTPLRIHFEICLKNTGFFSKANRTSLEGTICDLGLESDFLPKTPEALAALRKLPLTNICIPPGLDLPGVPGHGCCFGYQSCVQNVMKQLKIEQ